jgi:hypothetical protein
MTFFVYSNPNPRSDVRCHTPPQLLRRPSSLGCEKAVGYDVPTDRVHPGRELWTALHDRLTTGWITRSKCLFPSIMCARRFVFDDDPRSRGQADHFLPEHSVANVNAGESISDSRDLLRSY